MTNKIRQWFTSQALWMSGRLMTWAHMRMAEDRDWDPEIVKRVSQSEQNAIWDQVRAVIKYQAGEVEMLEARLSRRFDPGMALNEAANRAMVQKQAARDPQLTAGQLMALKVQEETVNRWVERS